MRGSVRLFKLRNRVRLNNRALSPIFATLILLGIVTTLFVPVFIWVTGMTSNTNSSWQQSGTIASERIVVEEVNLVGASPQYCDIYVRNLGETAISINDVIISSVSGTSKVYQKTDISTVNPANVAQSLSSVSKGNLIEIRISTAKMGFTVVNGTTYTVQVFTGRGVGDSFQVKALWNT
jgi:flagellin-like protein